MKRLALLLALFPSLAWGQIYNEYRAVTPAQILPYTNTSRSITAAFYHRLVRLVCSTSCYVTFFEGDTSVASAPPVTTVTGILLPPLEPEIFRVTPGDKVFVIRDSGDGELHVLEIDR